LKASLYHTNKNAGCLIITSGAVVTSNVKSVVYVFKLKLPALDIKDDATPPFILT
jgi:hypothetical protein